MACLTSGVVTCGSHPNQPLLVTTVKSNLKKRTCSHVLSWMTL